MDAGNHQLLVWQTLQHIRLFYIWPSKKVFYQFSAKVRCYLFITSSNPRASPVSKSSRTTSPSPHVPASLSPHVPTSPSPHVPTSPRPRVPESPRPWVPTSLSPRVLTSQRPHAPESPRPQVPKSHVLRPRPTFSNSHFFSCVQLDPLSPIFYASKRKTSAFQDAMTY